MARRPSAHEGTPTNARPTSRRSRTIAAALLTILLALSACAQATPPAPTVQSAPQPGQVTATTSRATATALPTAIPPTSTPSLTPPTRTALAIASATSTAAATPGTATCAPGVELLSYTDALDKTTFADTAVGGLSALHYDPTRDRYLALVDNERETPARVYILRIPLTDGKLGTPTVEAVVTLRDENGQPFTGRTLDGEGLAIDPGGDLLVASETGRQISATAQRGADRRQGVASRSALPSVSPAA